MIRHFFIFSLILAIPTATTVAFIPSPRFRDDSHRQRGSGEVPDHYHIEDDPPPGMTAPSVTRRDILERGGNHAAAVWMTTTAAGPVAAAVPTPALTATTTTTTTTTITPNTGSTKGDTNLLADLPMVRLKLPPGGLGREYLALRVRVGHHGPYTFIVDTGLTTELITPHLREQLSVPSPTTETSASTTTGDRSSSSPKTTIRGLAAGGVTNNPLVELRDVAIVAAGGEGGGFGDEQRIPVPGVLHAVVTDFPQEHMDPAHDPVEGMVGMEALRMFDVDLDFPAERIRLYKPGTVGTTGVATRARLVKIPAVIINETGLLGIRVTTATATATATTTTTTTTSHSTETIQSQQQQQQQQQQQPILGVLDCGATFSVINTAATRYMGLPSDTRNDPLYKRNPVVAGVGIDGRPITLSSAPTKFTFVGDVISDPTTGRPTGFGPPPPIWEPWDMVSVAVGDIPAFSTILGDGVTPYQGPVALIGLDVLAQRRVVLESVPPNSPTRNRRVWVSPK